MYSKTKQGTMSEWLGNGLQNRLQQFESAWYLKKRDSVRLNPFFCMACRDIRVSGQKRLVFSPNVHRGQL